MLKNCSRKSYIILLVFIITVFLIWFFIPLSPDRKFAALADAYFDDFYYPTSPTAATAAGIHQYDSQLENYSKAGVDYQINELKKYQARVERMNPATLSLPVQGDRELLLHSIKSQLLTLQTIRSWEKDPDIYSSGITSSIFVIMARQFAPSEKRLRTLIAREKQIPAVFDEARKNLNNPPKIFTQVALEQLPGMIRFFQKDVPLAFADVKNPALQQQFTDSNTKVIQALHHYQTWLQTILLPHAHGDFRLGKETFRKKLWYDEMVDTSLGELIALGMKDLQHNQKEFVRVAKAIDPSKTPQQVLEMMMADHPDPDKLLKEFTATFDSLIQFIKTKHIITIASDIRPTLQETPPFMRATTFASMDVSGPFEKVSKEAYFNVTLPDASWDKQKTEEFMRGFNYPVMNSISVHETYPGHYVQFLRVGTIQNRVRKILGSSSNSEGWAHYCEQMMLDEGFGPTGKDAKSQRELNMLHLGQLWEALLRDARFIVGIKMHTGPMTFEEAVRFFEKQAYQSHTSSVMEAKRGTSNPTYLYYTLGKLEILKLRAEVQAKQGAAFNLQKFHDDFVQQGYPPIKIVRRALLQG